jgi:hypothetical protein
MYCDTETYGLIAITLGNLIVDSEEMRADVVSEGAISHFTYALDMWKQEHFVQGCILFFVQSCLKAGFTSNQLLPALRTLI